jgi:hypothetical protein
MNPFSAYTLTFVNRFTFDFAVLLVQKLEEEQGENLYDVGHADMTITIFSSPGLKMVKSELSVHQIWDISSFKGAPDFSVKEA